MPREHGSDAFFEGVGRIYGVTRPEPVVPGFGHGWSSSGDRELPTSISLEFRVGRRADGVKVETGPEPEAVGPLWWTVQNVLLHYQGPDDLAFPLTITIDESEVVIPVDDVEVSFRAISCNGAAIAVAEVAGRSLELRSPVALLAELALASMDHDQVERWLASKPSWDKREDEAESSQI